MLLFCFVFVVFLFGLFTFGGGLGFAFERTTNDFFFSYLVSFYYNVVIIIIIIVCPFHCIYWEGILFSSEDLTD